MLVPVLVIGTLLIEILVRGVGLVVVLGVVPIVPRLVQITIFTRLTSLAGGYTGGGIAQPGWVFIGCGVGRAEDICTVGCLKVESIWGEPGVYAGG